MYNNEAEKNSYEDIKEKVLDELKEQLENGDIDIDKYYHLRSLV